MLDLSPDNIMSESIESFWKEYESLASLASHNTEQTSTSAPWIVREQVNYKHSCLNNLLYLNINFEKTEPSM